MFHSQDGQDEFLEKHVFKGFRNGVFVDVGAHDGVTINNTLFFEKEREWKGICIEPIKTVFSQLCKNREKTLNINCAISDNNGKADFYLNKGYTEMISGLKDCYDTRHKDRLERENKYMGSNTCIISIPTMRLDTLLEKYGFDRIHYLSIDVEGAEEKVIKSIDYDKIFIDVIGFENNFEDISLNIVKHLKRKGYSVLSIGLDIFMIHCNSKFTPS